MIDNNELYGEATEFINSLVSKIKEYLGVGISVEEKAAIQEQIDTIENDKAHKILTQMLNILTVNK